MKTLISMVLLAVSFPAVARDKLCLNALSSRVFPGSPLSQNETLRFDINNDCRPRHPDKHMIYSCRFSTLNIPESDCSKLPGELSFNQRTGVFSWTPGENAYGAYFFEIIGSYKKLTESEIFIVDVQSRYPLSGLRREYDADFARIDRPAEQTDRLWHDLVSEGETASIQSTIDAWSLTPPLPFLRFGPNTELFLGKEIPVLFHAWLGLNKFQVGNAVLWSQGPSALFIHGTGPHHLRLTGQIPYVTRILSGSPAAYYPLTSDFSDHSGGASLSGGGGVEMLAESENDSFVHFSSGASSLFAPISEVLESVSIEGWARLMDGESGTLVSAFGRDFEWGSSYVLLDVLSTGEPRFFLRDNQGRSISMVAPDTIVDGHWHHVAATYGARGAELFVDGKRLARAGAVLSLLLDTVIIGGSKQSAASFVGELKEVAIYPRALSYDEIGSHADRTWGCVTPEPLSTTAWQLLSILDVNGRSTVYINGKPQCSVGSLEKTGSWRWGTAGEGAGWRGGLSSVRVYNAADVDAASEYYRQTAGRYASLAWDDGEAPLPESVTDFLLTVVKTGQGQIVSDAKGIDCGAYCSASFDAGTLVQLMATPSSDSVFVGWSGGSCFGTEPCTVSMSQTQTVDAVFERQEKTVSIEKVGSGSVISDPLGINCGETCSGLFRVGSTVTLRAVPSQGSVFSGWIGGECGNTETCSFTVQRSTRVVALFNYRLTVSKMGGGIVTASSGTLNCGARCEADYAPSTTVTLVATPVGDSIFGGWGGGWCSGTGTCTVTMNQALLVTVTFLDSYYDLSVTKYGGGTILSDPAGINCGAVCQATYSRGKVVTLRAIPGPNETFSGWSGGWCSGVSTCTVTMNQKTQVVATFSLPVRVVTIGHGTVSSTPEGIKCTSESDCTYNFSVGSSFVLRAIPEFGSQFSSWRGGWCSGAGECTITVQSPMTIFATFLDPKYAMSIVSKSGAGSVVSSPNGINCGETCSYVFDQGTAVTLSAYPAPGQKFDGWGGGWCSGTGTCAVRMDQYTPVMVVFSPQ